MKSVTRGVLSRFVVVFYRGSPPDPDGGAYDATVDPLVDRKVDTAHILQLIDAFGVSVSAPRFVPPSHQILGDAFL